MDAWNNLDGPELNPKLPQSSAVSSDSLLASIQEIKDELTQLVGSIEPVTSILEDEDDGSEKPKLTTEQIKQKFFHAICEGNIPEIEEYLASDPLLASSLFNGYLPLVLAVALDEISIAEILLDKYEVDPEVPDLTTLNYSPLMWAVHFDNLPMTKLLLEHQADINAKAGANAVTPVSLVTESTPAVYLYFKYHNLLESSKKDDFVYHPQSFGFQEDPIDDLSYKIQMLTIAANLTPEPSEEFLVNDTSLADSDEDEDLRTVPDYDYSKAVPGQYIKYTDSDIPSLLDYIFNLRLKTRALQHDARVPAAIIYQLIQYSHTKVGANDLTQFLFETFITRVRAVTNTKSGVITELSVQEGANGDGAGDIVSLSYWLSVIQFIHLHLTRGKIYKVHPEFLQNLIGVTQSLIAAISYSINSRLNVLVDECILDFTNLIDVSRTTYAKDWNLFKSKKTPNSYDDILDMLFPPSEEQLRMPSPIKYLQVLGALDYVLNLHMVHPLLRSQAYSQVFYFINATLFNRIISNSKYCSRVKAIQLRLNISTLEDWLRSHSTRIFKPDQLGGLELLTDNDTSFKLIGLLGQSDNPKDPHSLGFLYKSIYHVGRTQLNPLIELLQWLQVVTGLNDEETFVNTMNELDDLNYYQLFKVTKKLYRYEVDEPKVHKALIQLLKRLLDQEGQNQVSRKKTSYLSQSSFLLKELYISMNPNLIFGVALPNLSELIVSFGAGLGGIRKAHAKKYQPHLPAYVLDDIDEIILENRNTVNDAYDYDSDNNSNEDAQGQDFGYENNDSKFDRENMLYKKIQPPLVAHQTYGNDDIDVNPW